MNEKSQKLHWISQSIPKSHANGKRIKKKSLLENERHWTVMPAIKLAASGLLLQPVAPLGSLSS